MKALLRLATVVLAIFGVFRLGFALQRIDHANVVADGATCASIRGGTSGRSCLIEASLAGRLDGSWTVEPSGHPDLTYVARDVAYSYTRNDWRLAWGATYWLPALFLLVAVMGAAVPVAKHVRGTRSR